MMQVWKWKLPRQRKFALMMPGGKYAEVLHIGTDGENGFLWARINPASEQKARSFERHLTGSDSGDLSDTAKHLGTYTESDGFTAHIFEEMQ